LVVRMTRSRTSGAFVRSQLPMYDSLRPPPYASAVSKVVIPASQAASRSACASPSVSPEPKNAGAEPIPPKLPQPRMIRDTATPLRPSVRCSMPRL
jgi:hypothetical protein